VKKKSNGVEISQTNVTRVRKTSCIIIVWTTSQQWKN